MTTPSLSPNKDIKIKVALYTIKMWLSNNPPFEDVKGLLDLFKVSLDEGKITLGIVTDGATSNSEVHYVTKELNGQVTYFPSKHSCEKYFKPELCILGLKQ